MRPGPQRLRVPGRRLHDLRERQRRDRVRLRLETDPAHQCPPLRQDGRDGPQGQRLVGARLGRASHSRRPGVAGRVRDRPGRPQRPRAVPPRGRAGRRAVALGLLHRGVAHVALSECGLQPLPVAGRSPLAGRAVGVTCPRRHRTAVHPGVASGPHRCANLMPALVGYLVAFAAADGDDRHRRHDSESCCDSRGQRRDRPPDDLRRAGPSAVEQKGGSGEHRTS